LRKARVAGEHPAGEGLPAPAVRPEPRAPALELPALPPRSRFSRRLR